MYILFFYKKINKCNFYYKYTQTQLCALTLTLPGTAACCQAGGASGLAVVFHAGLIGGVNQARLVW